MHILAQSYIMVFTLLLGCTSAGAGTDVPSRPAHKSLIAVDDLLTQIQRALVRAQNSTEKEELPPLESVVLTLSTQYGKNGEGKLNLYIVTVGGGIGKNTAQTLVLKLTPPQRGTPLEVGREEFSQQLSEAIISAAKAAYGATKREPPLSLEKLDVIIKFVVTKEGSGGIELAFMPIGLKVGGQLMSEETQEMVISFQRQN